MPLRSEARLREAAHRDGHRRGLVQHVDRAPSPHLHARRAVDELAAERVARPALLRHRDDVGVAHERDGGCVAIGSFDAGDERRALRRVGMVEAFDVEPDRSQVAGQRIRVAALVPRVDVAVVHAPVADERLQQLDDLPGATVDCHSARSTHASMSRRAMLIPGGTIGSSSGAIPVGVRDLGLVDHDVAAGPPRGEPEHQRVRERPRLARDVPNVGQLDADLFAHLAMHRLLERLPRLDEPGEAAVHRHREQASASEEGLGAVGAIALDEHDDRGCEPGKRAEAAMRAASRALVRREAGLVATATAIAMRAIPLDELHRTAGDGPLDLADAAPERTQRR